MSDKTIKASEIKTPIKHGEAPKINWGEDFNELGDIYKIIYLKTFSESMNHAASIIQDERNELIDRVVLLEEMLKSAETTAQIQRNLIANTINSNNETQASMAEEIAKLKRG